MKQKLKDVILTNTPQHKVLYGLNFSMASFIGLYLMKVQKFNLVAMTVCQQVSELAPEGEANFMKCHFSYQQIEIMKSYCRSLDIPFFVEDQTEEFRESVLEVWMSDLINSKKPRHCMRCFEFKMSFLFKKMKDLECDYLSTGHFAKVLLVDDSASKSLAYASSASDLFCDQSRKVARLPQDILSSLILPLGDITQKDCLVLAKNFGLDRFFEANKTVIHEKNDDSLKSFSTVHSCLPLRQEQFELIKKKLSPLLREKTLFVSNEAKDDKNLMIHFQEKMMKNVIEDKFIWVADVVCAEQKLPPHPFDGFASTESFQQILCRVYPKSLHHFLLEFDTAMKTFSGESIALFKRKGRHAKIIFSGEVRVFKKWDHEALLKMSSSENPDETLQLRDTSYEEEEDKKTVSNNHFDQVLYL